MESTTQPQTVWDTHVSMAESIFWFYKH